MATVNFTAIETPDMLPLTPGTKYLLQFLGIRQDADPVWVWTPQGMARARLTFAEAV